MFTPQTPMSFGVNKPTGQPIITRAEKRRIIEATKAVDLLTQRPHDDETIHTIMSGKYDLSTAIAATVKRWPVTHLRVATLAANKRSFRELLDQIEAKTIGTLEVLVSGFFARHNKELYLSIRDELRDDYAPSRIAAAKNHCKIALFEFADGTTPMVFEGSANLRKNDSLEQLTVTRSRTLHDWHAAWIGQMIDQHANDPLKADE